MSIFFDTDYDQFDYDLEKSKFISNLEYLKSMSVEENTLYKKWIENKQYKSKYDSSRVTKSRIWTPTDIFNKDMTISEIENLNPIIRSPHLSYEETDWINLRYFVASNPYNVNPGRLIKYLIIDKNTDKYLGISSIGSDVTSISNRDSYIGWNRENKFNHGKLNNIAIGTTIVPTQPFGYNFLGGKLIASMLCTKTIRDDWKKLYNNVLVGITTTSLYGQGSMYNGIPFWKSLGETSGKIHLHPDNEIYEIWHDWIKKNRKDIYEEKTMRDENDTANGPVSGIKQTIVTLIMRELNLKPADYVHGYKRGLYFSPFYENFREFLTNKIDESDLILKSKLSNDVQSILTWWKDKAIKRYIKLYSENKLNPHILYYNKISYMEWNEVKRTFLNDVGR